MLKFQMPFKIAPRDFCLLSGAPRSGTTALIDWLARQSRIAAFQESRILIAAHRCLDEVDRFGSLNADSTQVLPLVRNMVLGYYAGVRNLAGKQLLMDKEPLEPVAFPSGDYARFLLHVRSLFPASRFLFVVRDPVATVWSMTRRAWGESLTTPERRTFTIEEHTQNWCICADLALQYCSEPNTYIVQFGRMMRDPAGESRRILAFLGIRAGPEFVPHPTKDVGFTKDEAEAIRRGARPQLELLGARGMLDL
jgi:hypothetical protein